MGVIIAWIEGIAGLVCVVASYVIFMPMIDFMVHVTTSLGAPAGIASFLAKNAMWGFILLGLVCIAYPIIYSYKITYDQGQSQRGFR